MLVHHSNVLRACSLVETDVKAAYTHLTLACHLQTAEGWSQFSGGWLVGGLSGVAWAYILTLLLPFYS